MNKLIIGQSKLVGEVDISGAKNSALKLLAASILSAQPFRFANFPVSLLDIEIHVEMLRNIGKVCTSDGANFLISEGHAGLQSDLEWHGRSIRNTLLILGALTARTGRASVPFPGGCNLGERAYDIHELVLTALGARVWSEENRLFAEAEQGLRGADICLPMRSTGATENALLCASLAKGTTRIWNPHIRPEILDLVGLLRKMGANVEVFGQERIEVEGFELLQGASHRVMPDNMEAITWVAGAAMTGGDVQLNDFPWGDLEVAMIHLRESGVQVFRSGASAIVRGSSCYPLDICTGPHPAINSDVQPILAAFAARAVGESRIVDLRFRGRYGYVAELRKLGVDCAIDGDLLRVHGRGGELVGTDVEAVDLRAGASLMLCGLVAAGETIISNAWQIQRGYCDLTQKLAALGARFSHE